MSGEFVPMIAHTIREQICLARLQFEDALQAPHLETRPLRYEPMTDAWGPEIKLLDEEELGRIAKEKERESRYLFSLYDDFFTLSKFTPWIK